MIIAPCDIYATAEALHQGLVMNMETRQIRAARLRWLIEKDDIHAWLNAQLETIKELNL
jgi:trehalose-6-phosphate synthase